MIKTRETLIEEINHMIFKKGIEADIYPYLKILWNARTLYDLSYNKLERIESLCTYHDDLTPQAFS